MTALALVFGCRVCGLISAALPNQGPGPFSRLLGGTFLSKYPFLPLSTDAYIGDTDHLTFAEHGAYFRLLMIMWRTPGCRIPNDPEWIKRRLRASESEYENLIKPIIKEFCQTTGNWVTQKRLQNEYDYVKNKSKNQSARAKFRWDKEKDVCPTDAAPHQSGNAPTPIPNIDNTPPLSPPTKKVNGSRGTVLPDDWKLSGELYIWTKEQGLKNIPRTIEIFKDYWIAQPGVKGRKKDWSRTWKNWVRREMDNQHAPSSDDVFEKLRKDLVDE